MSQFIDWVKALAGDNVSERGMARRTGINAATFHRKWAEDAFTPDDAVKIARAYGRSPIEALVQLGTLTKAEAMKAERGYSLGEYTTLELSQEVARRLAEGHDDNPDMDKPISDFLDD